MTSVLKNKKGSFIPEKFDIAHELCFVLHDVLLQIIKSGEEGGFFLTKIDLLEGEDKELAEADDVFLWLKNKGRFDDRAKILVPIVLPAVLSDSLHCIYEALESSRKAKLAVTYMLIRKPLQESLYLLESVVLNKLDFTERLASDPMMLRPKNAGGVDGHRKRIKKILCEIGEDKRLDAQYLAQLRYDKKSEDSFDGICNHAMHLFTEHHAIRTANLNINFIFSGWNQNLTQWEYLYSRLPYILFYMHRLVEFIIGGIAPTSQEYLDDINRRISALIIFWWNSIDENYRSPPLEVLFQETEKWLNSHCEEKGFPSPTLKNLKRMSESGAYPGESYISLKKRGIGYRINAAYHRIKAKR